MGHWNHRVVRHVCKAYKDSAEPECNLELQEVFYGVPDADEYAHGSVSLHGESVADLAMTIERLNRALTMSPIIDCKCDASKEG